LQPVRKKKKALKRVTKRGDPVKKKRSMLLKKMKAGRVTDVRANLQWLREV